ncbi:MAG: ASKHA domain-containing protein [Deltaproteobacteria bacterium]|nr:ASKHA domain-containing protein [Deltaproteobacteria bacterium]MCL5277726.1 ASKHA domain-containing protein [Deltaproteobacteria bacterium]
MKPIKTRLVLNDRELTIYANAPGSLLEIIVQAGVAMDAPCAGIGRCGKCRVTVEGELPPDGVETSLLSHDEIESGTRLACRRRRIPTGLTIRLSEEKKARVRKTYEVEPADVGVAVDLGTTSIAIAFINLSHGTIMTMRSILNPQRIYGADVVSRIKAALDREVLDRMAGMTMGAVSTEIRGMLSEIGLDAGRVKGVYVAGNTAMEHIVSGTDVSGLAKAPYMPAFNDMRYVPGLRLESGVAAKEVGLFPVIGGFVGGDTVASLLASTMDISDETVALIDIGTNAEIAIGSRSGILVSSAPAGPAFEGGQIRHGMRAQDGAIEDIHLSQDSVSLDVKGGVEPAGICGSGLIRIVSELLRAGVIAADGELLDAGSISNNLFLRLRKRGGEQAFVLYKSYDRELSLYQSDVRALQLAKASIAAGLDVLTERIGAMPVRLYIAGAFGNYLRPDDLASIGLIPSKLTGDTYFIGDSVISGIRRFIINEPKVDMERLISNTRHIELADDPAFNRRFLSMIGLRAFK